MLAQATDEERKQILEAIFDLSREEIVKRVQAGTMKPAALAVHDYVYDIFPAAKEHARRHAMTRADAQSRSELPWHR